MEIFDNIFLKIFSGLIGIAFIIYWLQYFPVISSLKEFIHSILNKRNRNTLDDIIEQQKKDEIDEQLKKIESGKLKKSE